MMAPPMKSERKLPLLLAVIVVLAFAALLFVTIAPSTNAVGAPQSMADSAAPNSPAGISVIGDLVWLDDDRDGLHNPGEPGINGILVNLWLDDGDGRFDPTQDPLIDQMNTGDNPGTPGIEQGWYLFDGLDGGHNYWVEIDASNFDSGGPLENYELTSGSAYGASPMFVSLATEPSEFRDADFGYAPQAATIAVTKTAAPASLPEPGGTVTFTVTIDNQSPAVSVTIDTLSDDIHGNLNGQGDCSAPQTIPAGDSYSCQFSANISGNAGDSETDVVTVSGTDSNQNPVSGQDNATVHITNAPSSMQVLKTANPASLPEPGGAVTFTVQINNTSAADSITVNTLTDSIYGDLNGQGNCSMPQIIPAGGSYSCHFTADVTGNSGDVETDRVTANATDDDGGSLSDSDDATVTITNASSSIIVTKGANPTTVPVPGGDVTFSVHVENTSSADTITIDRLVDDVFGDLNGQGTCVAPFTLPPGHSYDCNFIAHVSGDAGDSHTDTVTASGADDDGSPVSGEGTAVVTITSVASAVVVTKTADPTSVEEPGGTVTFTVRINNTSSVNSFTITKLTDTIYGDLNGQGTCSVPQTITAGHFYECHFTGNVTGSAGDSETDTITAIGTDENGHTVGDYDTATVNIISPISSIELTKTANPVQLAEPGGLVQFNIVVTNTSNSRLPVTINSLLDDVYGNLNGQGTCSLPQTINAEQAYSCAFLANYTGAPGDFQVDIVTASGTDSQSNPVQSSDSAHVSIIDSPSSLAMTKDANPASVPEPGGVVTFTFGITNTSAVDSITIDTLTDSVYGNLNGRGDCHAGQTLAPGATYTCQFSTTVSGNAGDSETNTAIVTGTDDDGNDVHASDTATVNVIDVPASIVLSKTADPTNLPEPGGQITFTVVVTNTSPADAVTLDSLADSIHGNLNGQGDCAAPQTLAVGETYTCSFTANVTGNAGYVETDVITARGTDDDGSGVSATADADVFITDALPAIELIKTANPSTVPEPGGVVSFTITISNTSHGDAVNLLTLADSVFGDLDGQGDCSVPKLIPVGGSYSCTFSGIVRGDEGDAHKNVAIASGFDDENNPVVDSDEEIVSIGLPSSVPGCISGYKVDDRHVGLPGWKIHTRPAGGSAPEYTAITDGSGYFKFRNLTPGQWEVWEEMQSGWEPVTSARFEVTVFSGSNCVRVRFKNRQAPVTATPTSTLTHTPTLTPTHTPTLTPTHTPTLAPTYTPTGTLTPTPTPTNTPGCPCNTPTPTPTLPPGCNENARLKFNIWGVDYSIPLWEDAHPWSVWGLPHQFPTTFTVENYYGSRLTWIMYQPFYKKQNGGHTFVYPGGRAGEDFTMYVWTDCGRVQLQGVIDDPTPTPGPPEGMPHQVWIPIFTNVGVFSASPYTPTPMPTRAPTPTPPAAPSPYKVPVSGLHTPNDIAYNPQTGRLYITNRDSGSVLVLNSQLQPIATVQACSQPFGVDVNTRTNRVYVACAGSSEVAVIDGAANRLLKKIATGYFPTYVGVNERTNRIYVASHDSNLLEEINGNNHTVVRKLSVSAGAFGLAVDENRNRVYVGSRNHNLIAVYDVASWRLLRDYRANDEGARGEPFALAFNPNNNRLYVTYQGPTFFARLGVFKAIDGGLRRLANLDLPRSGDDATGRIAINLSTNHVFVPNTASNSVTIVDGASNRILRTVYVGGGPFSVVVNSNTGMAYVGAKLANQLWVVPDSN